METAKEPINLIRSALTKALKPVSLTINDESHLHIGHTGIRSGSGHFVVEIVSDVFEGKTAVQRHQMVYKALGDLMKFEIHAVNIIAKTPIE